MHERVEKVKEPLQGVKCVVSTCYYNKPGNYCNASQIEIQSKKAQNTQETDCATFIQKS